MKSQESKRLSLQPTPPEDSMCSRPEDMSHLIVFSVESLLGENKKPKKELEEIKKSIVQKTLFTKDHFKYLTTIFEEIQEYGISERKNLGKEILAEKKVSQFSTFLMKEDLSDADKFLDGLKDLTPLQIERLMQIFELTYPKAETIYQALVLLKLRELRIEINNLK